MFVLFSIAVSFIKSCFFRSYILIKAYHVHFPANKCLSPSHVQRLDESNTHEFCLQVGHSTNSNIRSQLHFNLAKHLTLMVV